MIGRSDRLRIVLDHENGVPSPPKAPEEPEERSRVPRVDPDGGLVQDVDRVHQVRAQRVREADALGLAAG